MAMLIVRVLLVALVATTMGCAVNPVTGQRELTLVSTAQEVAIGRDQFGPAQQMQGGSYKVDRALTEYVSAVGNRVALHSGRDLPYEFVVLNNSTPNAWALPGGKIALNRGLLVELQNEAELAAVLGHEIAHAAARHGAKRVERNYVTQAGMLAVMIGSSGQEWAGEIIGGAQLAAGLLNQRYSRDAEREADYYGTEFMAKAGYDPYAAVTLQETFVRLSGERNTDWLRGLFASHPPSTERVSNNRILVRRMKDEGVTGEFNQATFAEALQRLQRTRDAYDEYDGALVLYEEGEYDAALNQVNAALRLENEEALFHGLRGAIRYKQGRYADALTNLDRAIARDAGYFQHYLVRGLTLSTQGQRVRAKQDLTQSVNLLPTASAYHALGELAEAEGDAEAAMDYYAAASQSSGAAGQTALASLLRLELPRNPSKYIYAAARRGSRGELILEVTNRAQLAVEDVRLRVEIRRANGTEHLTETVARVNAGGSRISTIGEAGEDVLGVEVYPLSARVAQ